MDKVNTAMMEVAIASHLDPMRKIILPNAYWGAGLYHECDLLVISGSGYATEIEIKISKSDLKKDSKKPHGHISKQKLIKYLYFAVPEYLLPIEEYVPERAGIMVVYYKYNRYRVRIDRKPKMQECRKWTDAEIMNVLRLQSMRVWNLKRKLCENKMSNIA